MTRERPAPLTGPRIASGLLAAALVLATAGCTVGTDDELAPPPTHTVTATPSQSVAPAPATIPVGKAEVSPHEVVWAQGTVLHVGRQEVDLRPIDIEAFVVVHGGVFVLADRELWFTDLRRVSGTGQTDVVGVQVSADGGRLKVVDTRSGRQMDQGYDTRTGRAIRGAVRTQSARERLRGPGRFHVTTSSGTPTVVSSTGRDVQLTNAPQAFELGGWTRDSAFYGVGRLSGGPRSVVSCDAIARRCREVARLTGTVSPVFGTGK